jgi:hypothetical protein
MENSTNGKESDFYSSSMFFKAMDDDPDTLQYVSRQFKDPVNHFKSLVSRLSGHPGGYIESVFHYIGNDLSEHTNKHAKYIMEMYYDLRFLKNVLQELGMLEGPKTSNDYFCSYTAKAVSKLKKEMTDAGT